jgi:hypothetical protein
VPFLRTLAGEFGAEVRAVSYEFQVGANQKFRGHMTTCSRRVPSTPATEWTADAFETVVT